MPATEAYIEELKKDRQEQYRQLHRQIEENRKLRYLQRAVEIPKNYQATTREIRTPVIPDMLLRVISTLTTDPPQINCPPSAPTDKAQRNSSLRERWTKGALDQMQEEQGRAVLRMGVDAACADGLGVWKLIHRADAWAGEPKRERRGKRTEDMDGKRQTTYDYEEDAIDYLGRVRQFRQGAPFPLLWTDVDSMTFLPLHDGIKMAEVLEVSQRPLVPAMRALGVRRNADGTYDKLPRGEPVPLNNVSNPSQTVECVEHWDDRYATYVLDNKIVDQVPHRYGRVPYFPFAGHSTSSRKPHEANLSVIEPFKQLVPAVDSLLTMWTNLIYLYAWPFLVEDPSARQQSIDPGGPENVTEIVAGSIMRGLKFLQPPGVNRDLLAITERLQAMIDRSGIAAVMYGQGASSSSGYMVSQLMTAAQLVYRPILQNASMALKQMILHLWRIVEKTIRQDVYVWGAGAEKGSREWLSLRGEDIAGYYAVEVELKPLLPMDEIGRGDAGMRWHQAGGIDANTWREDYLGIDAPEEVGDKLLAERFMQAPEVQRRLQEVAFRKAFPEATAKLAAPPPGSLPPGPPAGPLAPGGPPGPPVPMPGPGGWLSGGGMAMVQPPGPQIPGVSIPLVPPTPMGAGIPPPVGHVASPPVGVQRRPGHPTPPPPS